MLELAKNRLRDCAFVGLVERFHESLALLSYTFNWEPTEQYSNRNVNPSRTSRENIAPKTLDRIRSLNRLDNELYDFARSLFDDRLSLMLNEVLRAYHFHHLETELPEQIHYTFDQPLNGFGWQDREVFAQYGTFRWTGPETQSTLNIHIASERDLYIHIQVVAAVTAEVFESLSLEANGTLIPLSRSQDPAGITVLEGIIPSQLLSQSVHFLRLCFSVSQTIAPSSITSSSDSRALGVAINSISLTPVST